MKKLLYILIMFGLLGCDSIVTIKDSIIDQENNISQNQSNKIDSLETLKKFINDGKKNGYIPRKTLTGIAIFANKLQPVDISNSSIIKWNINSRCESSGKKIILALDGKGHSIECNNGDAVYIAGKGNDWIEDAVGNDIFYGGEGNDTIKNSWGSDIFIFEENWGHDIIEFMPSIVDTSKIVGYDGSYPWKYSSFIVFGKKINRSDIYWDKNTLVHSKTGDSIKLSSKEINIIFSNESNSIIVDKNFIQTKKVPKKIAIEQLKADSLYIQNNIAYIANEGLKIVDLKDVKDPVILSEVNNLPGIATSVNIVGNIAYVTQSANYRSEGAGGWVSMIDISDLENPKILKILNFGNNIDNIAINGKYLYVADTNFSYKNKRNLFIYDISRPSKPKLVSKLKLKYFSRYIAYSNNLLFLSTFKSKLIVIDVKNPKKPKKLSQIFLFDKHIRGIKTDKNKILINQEGDTISILEINKNKKIVHSCDMNNGKANKWSSSSASAITIVNNLIYRAEYKNGVSIFDIKNCTLKQMISFDGISISSVGVINNTIIAMNKTKAVLYDMSKQKLKSTEVNPYLNLSNDQLQKLLYQAVEDDMPKKVIELMNKGTNPNMASHTLYTPFELSVGGGKLKALKAFLENGCVADSKSMIRAALFEKIDAMKLLEKFGGNIAQTDKDNCTTLHYIASDGSVDMVKYLISKDVPINATCRNNETALKWANFGKNIEVIQYLESIGAKP